MSAVKEGREEDVMTYLSTADRTSHDWQKNLDLSVVIAIKGETAKYNELTCECGGKLGPDK